MIEFQIDSSRLSSSLEALGRQVLQFDVPPSMLMSFTELCSLVDRVEGVHLGELVEDLPKRAPSGQAALAEVVRLARKVSHDDLTADARGLAAATSALATLLGVNEDTSERAAESSGVRGDVSDWRPLIDRMERLLVAGERGEDLVAGLDPAHAAIIQRLRGILTGEVLPDPESLRAGAIALTNLPGMPEGFKQVFEIMDKDFAARSPTGRRRSARSWATLWRRMIQIPSAKPGWWQTSRSLGNMAR